MNPPLFFFLQPLHRPNSAFPTLCPVAASAESRLLGGHGLADRPVAVFPGLVESIDTEDWPNAERWVTIIETSIASAEKSL